LEWFVMLWMATSIGIAATVDSFRFEWAEFAAEALTLGHLAAAPLVARFGGPFAHGGRWIQAFLGFTIAVPVLFGSLVAPGAFVAGPAGSVLCNYPAGTMVLFAFYPWWRGERTGRVVLAEYLLLAFVTALPVLMLMLVEAAPTGGDYLSALIGGSYNIVGFVLGKVIGAMCRAAARTQVELQQQAYEEFFDFLHSHVKAGIAAIRAEEGDTAATREKLDELEQAVSDRRVQFLLSGRRVPLATLVSERIRTFTGVLVLTETPRVGALTVPREVGVLVGRALGDLLKNAAVHGAVSAAVRLHTAAGRLDLEVADDGPGLPAAVLDDPARSLHRLRATARAAGGDLTAASGPAGGTVVRLVVPLDPATPERTSVGARAAR
ncbi:MAG: hypothetical protein L0K86_15495, partial [Actinomycetia bacterium]|nr:hypothetical protein [Actinomycetes bacterium]